MGELERRLAAELNDHALERAALALLVEYRQHVLGGQRLEIESVRSVVVRRDGLRIAVDHDRLVARRAQRERGVAAAIVELDPLPDPVRAAAEDDDLFALRGVGFASDLAGERGFVGRIHVGRGRCELSRAGVDALEHRLNAEPLARRRDVGFGLAGKRCKARVREAARLQRSEVSRVVRQAMRADHSLEAHDLGDPFEEPGVDLADLVDLLDAHAHTQRLRHFEQAIGRRLPDRGAQHVMVVAEAKSVDFDLVKPVEARLQRAQGLLQRLGEGAADRHRFADRFHRCGQRGFGAGKLLEREARDLGDDIVDRRLERRGRRAAGDVVGDLVERIADRQLGRDLGDRKTGRLRGQSRRARDARVHFDHHHAPVSRIDRELHIRAAGLDPDLTQNRDRGVAHDLELFVGQRQRRSDGDRIAGMHAHRVDVFDRADDDAIVFFVAHHLHLEFFPAEHALLDQDLVGRRGVDAALDDLNQFASCVGYAPAGAAHGEARADDRRQADVGHRGQRLRQRLHLMRARRLKADFGHRLAEELAVLSLVDRLRAGADHLDAVAVEHPHLAQAQRTVERGLAAHGRQQCEAARDRVALLGDDLLDDLGRDRLNVGPVRHVGIGHDGGGIGIDEDDFDSLRRATPCRPASPNNRTRTPGR